MGDDIQEVDELSLDDALEKARNAHVVVDIIDNDDPPIKDDDVVLDPPVVDSDDDTLAFKPKYSSHEEAEKGVKEAERVMHETRIENKRLTERVEELEAMDREGKDTDISDPEPPDLVQETVLDTIKTINTLDVTDPNYDKNVAESWSNSIKKAVETAVSDVDKKLDDRFKQDASAREEDQNITRTRTLVSKKVKDAGLNGDKNSLDMKLFWMCSEEAVGSTLGEQIDNTINLVNRVKADVSKPFLESQQLTDEQRAENEVLGLSGNLPDVDDEKEHKPLSFDDALRKSERRI